MSAPHGCRSIDRIMTAAEAHSEALRRIQAAKASGQHWLDLGDIEGLEQIPAEIAELAALRELGLGAQGYYQGEAKWDWKGDRWFDRPLADLSPLAGLSALQSLIVSDTKVSDLTPLASLSALQTLHVSNTSVSDLTPLAGLSALQSLNVRNTSVSDLTPLVGLSALQSLDMSHTPVSDLLPLSNLGVLRSLTIMNGQVSDLGPLASLTTLQCLNVSNCPVRDLTSVTNMNALEVLGVSHTQVSDLTPVANLKSLQLLDVSGCNCLSRWEPLKGALRLQTLNGYGAEPARLTQELVESLPSLNELVIDRIVDVPREVLSVGPINNCLNYFRSWTADLRQGEEKDQEVKIFVLGNGTAGKTQICRQLRNEGYDDQVPSTHGVQIGHFDLLPDTGQGATKAKLWDFGGQDIYHGTHALIWKGGRSSSWSGAGRWRAPATTRRAACPCTTTG